MRPLVREYLELQRRMLDSRECGDSFEEERFIDLMDDVLYRMTDADHADLERQRK